MLSLDFAMTIHNNHSNGAWFFMIHKYKSEWRCCNKPKELCAQNLKI